MQAKQKCVSRDRWFMLMQLQWIIRPKLVSALDKDAFTFMLQIEMPLIQCPFVYICSPLFFHATPWSITFVPVGFVLLLLIPVFWNPDPLFLSPAFQSELRHGPFYYVKQPALTTDPVDVVPQDGRNDFYCWVCHREGQVLCCELCPRVYHAKCLKLAAEPEGDWFCPECEVLAHVASLCVKKKST